MQWYIEYENANQIFLFDLCNCLDMKEIDNRYIHFLFYFLFIFSSFIFIFILFLSILISFILALFSSTAYCFFVNLSCIFINSKFLLIPFHSFFSLYISIFFYSLQLLIFFFFAFTNFVSLLNIVNLSFIPDLILCVILHLSFMFSLFSIFFF